MKKLSYMALGVIIGIVMTASTGVLADSNGLIGKKITGEVEIILDGKIISEKGSVAEGKSLLPVRTLANLFGADARYEDGKVHLTSKEQEQIVVENNNVSSIIKGGDGVDVSLEQSIQGLSLDTINVFIESAEYAISTLDKLILESDNPSPGYYKNLDLSKSELVILKKRKAELESQTNSLK